MSNKQVNGQKISAIAIYQWKINKTSSKQNKEIKKNLQLENA